MKTGDKSRELGEQELYRAVMGIDNSKSETYVYDPKKDNRPINKERCDICGKHSVNFPVVINDKKMWCICHADKGKRDDVEVYFNNPI